LPSSPAELRAVIFDCDGVLVETEVTSSEVMARCVARVGLERTPDEIRERFKGWALPRVMVELEAELGRPLPAGFLEDFITERLDVYRHGGVEQIPGAAAAVRAVLAAGLQLCVASQGTQEKMRVTLSGSGMRELLGAAPILSADDDGVARGKPAPDLYLHAAATLSVPPRGCVVVEDSLTGVQGGVAAGMRVLGYAVDADADAMAAAGGEPFFDMGQVPGLLGLA
jgi:beta-phosphoglucomutase-like phosphatase (HAD superfamily)